MSKRSILVFAFVASWFVIAAVALWFYQQGRVKDAYYACGVILVDIVMLPVILWQLKKTEGGSGPY